ncbi:hypothetical protein LZC95_52480 [Pendulispora brunnea]|uniref:Carboxypeptidase regulatory-like domain-containing protein n=1 Tax=Pendulispora brunnea TaxID=2905690 RepID=A0ABZ2K8L0_9BACT
MLAVAGCSAHDDAASKGETPAPGSSSKAYAYSDAQPIEPPPGPDDVVGLVQGRMGGPVGGVTIAIGGNVTTTDAWGRFVLRNAPARYDVQLGVNGRGQAYRGLSTRRPTLQSEDNGWFNGAPKNIDYSGALAPDSKIVSFEVQDGGDTSVIEDGQDRNTVIRWSWWAGPISPLAGTLWSLEYEKTTDGSAPTRYLGVASTPIKLSPNQEATFKPTFSPISKTSTVSGVARPAPGMTIYESNLLVRFGGQYSILHGGFPVRTIPANFVVPEIDGASWGIRYSAFDTGAPGSYGGANSSMSVPVGADGSIPDVTLPSAPKIILPADGATDFGVGSEIGWEGGEGACTVEVTSTDTWKSIRVTTLESRVSMPDLSAVGVPLAPHQVFKVNVWCARETNRAPDADPVLDWTWRTLGSFSYSRTITVSTP